MSGWTGRFAWRRAERFHARSKELKSSMTYQDILYDVTDQIATITLHRPDKLNAFTRRMQEEMLDAFDTIDRDDDVRAVIITGAGRAFCAGADLSAGATAFDARSAQSWTGGGSPFNADGTANYADPSIRDSGGLLTLRIFECLKPVIAAVNGPAVGIGATMLLPMDIRLSSSSAQFGFVFARRGVVPEAASSWFLPRIVPISKALEWCCTGRIFGAAEALDGGLVRSIHEPDDLLRAAYAIAAEIRDHSAPVSVALVRQLLWRVPVAQHPMAAHRIDSRLMLDRGMSADAREGIASFFEKRNAVYVDRVSADMPGSYPWWSDSESNW